MRLALLLLTLAACEQASNVGKVVVAGGPAAAIEAYCAVADDARCGLVFACEEPADNELGQIEICVSDTTDITEVEEKFGACVPSPHPRFEALGHRCLWRCPSQGGCQGFSGCWCPE